MKRQHVLNFKDAELAAKQRSAEQACHQQEFPM